MKRELMFCITTALVFGMVFSASAATKKKHSKQQPSKKQTVTFKYFNENDPNKTADNTITVTKDGKDTEVPIKENWAQKHLRMFEGKDVNMTTTYDPESGDYVVTHIEPFR